MRRVNYRWLLLVYLRMQASIKLIWLQFLQKRKTYTRPIYALLLGFPVQRNVSVVTWNIAFWTHFSTSCDKAKWQRQNCLQETVGKIDFKFSIVFVDLCKDATQ